MSASEISTEAIRAMEPRFLETPRRWLKWKAMRFCFRWHLWWLNGVLGIEHYMMHSDTSAVLLAIAESQALVIDLPKPLQALVRGTTYELIQRRRIGCPVKAAVRAPDIYFVEEPSARYLKLLFALRAGDHDAVRAWCHGGSFPG